MTVWKLYFCLAVAYHLGMSIYAYAQGFAGSWITTFLEVIFFVGLFGFAFERRLGSERIWRYVFAIGVVTLAHAWVIMPFVYVEENMSLHQILIIQAFQLPLVPMFVALYLYAWRSTDMWQGAA